MSNNQVSLYGAGGHSKVIAETLRAAGVGIAARFDDNQRLIDQSNGEFLPGIGLQGSDFQIPASAIVLAVGNKQLRQQLAQALSGARYAIVIHPAAVVAASVSLGAGTVVFAGAVIQPETVVGEHCIVNSSASIDHDCTIGDFCHIAPGATLCGGISIGHATHVGAGATVIESVTIGANATIGAGAVVIRDVPEGATVVGCPAKPLQ